MNFFCHLPWTEIISHDTFKAPCCKYLPVDLSQYDTFENYFKSIEMAQVQSQLLNGQAPIQCQNCVNDEKTTGHSFRLLHNEFHPEKKQQILDNKKNSQKIPIALSVTTSNTCNLLCLPCNGHGSYSRGVELNKIGVNLINVKHNKKNHELDNIHKYNFEHITFLGGEPFGDKVTFECLENLIKHKKSKNIVLDLNTNCTLIDQNNLSFLSDNFKFVNIKASIDGVGAVNDYLRYPSTWSDLESRLLLAQNYPNMSIMITTALSNLSLIKYYQVIEWAMKNSIKDLFLTPVSTPSELAVENLPTDIKKSLLEIYLDLKNRCSAEQMSDRTEFSIDTCVNICRGSSDKNFDHTITWLKKHDQHRKNNMLEVFPELIPYV